MAEPTPLFNSFEQLKSAVDNLKRFDHKGGGGNNGGMDGLDKRVEKLEKDVADIRVDVAIIKTKLDTAMPDLMSKAQGVALQTKFDTVLPTLMTKDMGAKLEADLARVETNIVKWVIATTLGATALAFAIARYIH